MRLQQAMSGVLGCYVPPNLCFKVLTFMLLGDRVFKEGIKVKGSHYGGSTSSMTGVVRRANWDTDGYRGKTM